jgi:hypothetical protein
MRVSSPGSGAHNPDGYTPKSFSSNFLVLKKPIVWVSLLIFITAIGIGFQLGGTLVLRPESQQVFMASSLQSEKTVITLLEVTDLGTDKPDLLSVWYIYIFRGENPRLGFTPVASISMLDEPNSKLLKEFSLDEYGNPSADFLSSLKRTKVNSDGYIIIDQAGVTTFLNWFMGKELTESTRMKTYSMSEYGQALRSLCAAFPLVADRGAGEFPWSTITPLHFQTSFGFSQVIQNMSFLTETLSPRCEMVALP